MARFLLDVDEYIANTSGLGGWEGALSQAQSFLDQLTTEEKFSVVTGTAG
jgi:beta-glucosidase